MSFAQLARGRVFPALLGIGSLIVVLALIQSLIYIGTINSFIVPLPTDIVLALPRLVIEENGIARFLATGSEVMTAVAALAIFGVSAGVLLFYFDILRRATETWVAAFASAPIVLMYPLFLVIFGRNAWTIVIMGFVAALPPVVLKTLEGLSGTRHILIDVGRSFNLSSRQLFWKIMLPSALPTIFVGLRLGLMFALINIVAVEFLINFGGLGQLINELAERYDLAGTYAAICFVILVSVLAYYITERLERWLSPDE